jgi:NAD+ synthase (glutamine-hydrolysing)
MQIAVAQINPALGCFDLNAEKILDFCHKSREQGAELVIFPECSIMGYHPFDLLERKDFVQKQLLVFKKIQKLIPKDLVVVLGLITFNKSKLGRPYFNSGVVFEKGRILFQFNKQLLPTGDIFDESRFIEPGDLTQNIFKIKGQKIFFTICEDIWAWPNEKGFSFYKSNPINKIKSKVDLIINLSASPFFKNKESLRHFVIKNTALKLKAPMIYCNMVGAQDEVIFEGASVVFNKWGKLLFQAKSLREDLFLLDTEFLNDKTIKKSSSEAKLSSVAALHRALVLGIRDFCKKTGLKKIHLGLSGGIDSALVTCLAVDAIGKENVHLLALPGPYSSPKSEKLARELAKNIGCSYQVLSISEAYEKINTYLVKEFKIKEFGIVQENLQARLRGLFLMGYSNAHNSLLLSTSNKSEYASGYSTLYGDMCGGLAPLGDLTKEDVYKLSNYYNEINKKQIIPQEIISRPPSAELRPNQKDQDTLPEYDLLDKAVIKLVEKAGTAKTSAEKWLLPVLMRTEFKRWQAPPILKVTSHAFGRGRRWPIAFKVG